MGEPHSTFTKYRFSLSNRIEDLNKLKFTSLYSFVETPRKFVIAKLSIRKLRSSSLLMKIRAYGSKALK